MTGAVVTWGKVVARYVPFVVAALSDHLLVSVMLVIVGWRVAALTMSSREARLFSSLATVASLLFVYLENTAISLS